MTDVSRIRRTRPGENMLSAHPEGITARLLGKEGRSIFLAMGILFLVGLSLCYWAELQE